MPKFIKGSQEAKDYMASIRNKRKIDPVKRAENIEKMRMRKENRDDLSRQVQVPIFGSETLVMPEYMAIKTKKGYRLVNPLTQERNLSTRNHQTSIKILRKPVKDMVLLEGIDVPISMSLFSKKDRMLIDKAFETVEIYASHKIPVNELPTIKLKGLKSRGRPEVLHKNVEYNKLHKKEEEETVSKKKKTKKKEPIFEEPIFEEPKITEPVINKQDEINKELFDNWDTTYLPVMLEKFHPKIYKGIEKKINRLTEQKKAISIPLLTSFIPFLDELFEYLGSDKTAVDVILTGLLDMVNYINRFSNPILKIGNYYLMKQFLNDKNKILFDKAIEPSLAEQQKRENNELSQMGQEETSGIKYPKKAEPKIEEPKPKKAEKTKKAEKPKKEVPIDNNELFDSWDTVNLPYTLSQVYPKVFDNIENKVNKLTAQNKQVMVTYLASFLPFLDDLFNYLGSDKSALDIIFNGLKYLAEQINNDADVYLNFDNYSMIGKYLNSKNGLIAYKVLKTFQNTENNEPKKEEPKKEEPKKEEPKKEEPKKEEPKKEEPKKEDSLPLVRDLELDDIIYCKEKGYDTKYKLKVDSINASTIKFWVLQQDDVIYRDETGLTLKLSKSKIDFIKRNDMPKGKLEPLTEKIEKILKQKQDKNDKYDRDFPAKKGTRQDLPTTKKLLTPKQVLEKLKQFKWGDEFVIGVSKLDNIEDIIQQNNYTNFKVKYIRNDKNKLEAFTIEKNGYLKNSVSRGGDGIFFIKNIKSINKYFIKNPFDEDTQGEGIMNKIKYINTVINGRNDYPPKVRGIIQKYGNQEIKSIVIRRNPLQSIMNFALNAVSLGGWNKNMEDKPYDTLFHLSIVLTLNNNVRVVIEKNEVINMDTVIKVAPKTETEDIPDIQPGLTLNTLLNNAKNRMGSKYFTYSAKDNNCQDFILAVLQANNIGNQEDYSFIKQDTKSLFEGLSTLRKVSNSITDLGAKVNEITQGAGLFKKINKALNPRKNGVSNAFRKNGPASNFGRKVGSVAVHQILPAVIQEGTAGVVTGLTGNPILGTVVGNTLGQYAGQKASDALAKKTGMGIIRKSRFVKGSQEAKDYMKKLREKRNK